MGLRIQISAKTPNQSIELKFCDPTAFFCANKMKKKSEANIFVFGEYALKNQLLTY